MHARHDHSDCVVFVVMAGILSVYREAQKSSPGSLRNRPRVRFLGVRRVQKVGPFSGPTFSYHEDRIEQKWDHFLVPFLGPTESVFFRLPSTVTDHFLVPFFGSRHHVNGGDRSHSLWCEFHASE